eukprot:1002028-Pelagomonas_calceolata.AAC.9
MQCIQHRMQEEQGDEKWLPSSSADYQMHTQARGTALSPLGGIAAGSVYPGLQSEGRHHEAASGYLGAGRFELHKV